KRLAYLGEAPLFGQYSRECKCQGYAGPEYPLDIWVIDLASGQETHVAEQPPAAHIGLANGYDLPVEYLTRSTPVWSSNGEYLAWTDIEINPRRGGFEGSYHLIVYDWTRAAIQTVIPLRVTEGVGVPVEVVWVHAGLRAGLAIRELYNASLEFQDIVV